MLCSRCGYQNAPGTSFCAKCGAPLNAAPSQPMYQQPMYQQPMYQPPQSKPGNGLGIASMIIGIVSLVFFCYIYLSIPAAIVSVILGGVGLSKSKRFGMKNGMAVAGIVCSCIALGLMIISIIALQEVMEDIMSEVFGSSYRY